MDASPGQLGLVQEADGRGDLEAGVGHRLVPSPAQLASPHPVDDRWAPSMSANQTQCQHHATPSATSTRTARPAITPRSAPVRGPDGWGAGPLWSVFAEFSEAVVPQQVGT
jgi:hypothetical protein